MPSNVDSPKNRTCYNCKMTESGRGLRFINGPRRLRYGSRLYCVPCYNATFRYCGGCNQIFNVVNLSEQQRCNTCGPVPICSRTFCSQPICCHASLDICDNCYDDDNDNGDDGYDNDDYEGDSRSSIISSSAEASEMLGFYGNPKDGLYLGVELEVEAARNASRFDGAAWIRKELPEFIICKSDGSVDNGFEINTAPAGLQDQKSNWKKVFEQPEKMKSYFKEFGDTNGMHVHFSRNAVTNSQIGRMMVFVHEKQNQKFMEMIAGRSLTSGNGGSYSRLWQPSTTIYNYSQGRYEKIGIPNKLLPIHFVGVHKKEEPKLLQWREDTAKPVIRKGNKIFNKKRIDSRGAFNDGNPDTIEIRMFAGTTVPALFYKNIEFVDAMIHFCQPGVASFRAYETPDGFVEYVTANRKDYPNLNEFIQTEWVNTKGWPRVRVQGSE